MTMAEAAPSVRGEPPPEAETAARKYRHLVWLGMLAGALLLVIGIRFMIVPRTAANNFGLLKDALGYDLHRLVGLRDIWLGALAIALAWLKEWRALALWFGLGAGVCFADAWIAAHAAGKTANTGFHVGSGIFCAAMAAALWRRRWSAARGGPAADADAAGSRPERIAS